MRRFSRQQSLVTLSDMNVTPLLDLAFVLLIIFVITRPLLEQGLDLNLPTGGQPDSQVDQENVETVEVGADGRYLLNGEAVSLGELEKRLVAASRESPELYVYVRGDRKSYFENIFAVIDMCIRNGITQVSFRAEPEREEES